MVVMVDTDDIRRRTTPGVWHKLPTGELITVIHIIAQNQLKIK